MCAKKPLKRICTQQRKAIRIIQNLKYNASTHEHFKTLEILKLDDMIDFELGKFSYQFTNNELPENVKSLFMSSGEIHSYQTRGRNHPIISKHKSNIYNKSFLARAPSNWTKIKYSIRSSPNPKTFTKAYKNELVKSYI